MESWRKILREGELEQDCSAIADNDSYFIVDASRTSLTEGKKKT